MAWSEVKSSLRMGYDNSFYYPCDIYHSVHLISFLLRNYSVYINLKGIENDRINCKLPVKLLHLSNTKMSGHERKGILSHFLK